MSLFKQTVMILPMFLLFVLKRNAIKLHIRDCWTV